MYHTSHVSQTITKNSGEKPSAFLKFFFIFFLVFISVTEIAKADVFEHKTGIIETKQIEDLLQHIDKDTLLIFDLDNTLIEPYQSLGSDQWFGHHLQQQEQAMGTKSIPALMKAVDDYEAIQQRSKVQLIDPKINTIFKHAQDMGIKMLGLTSRGSGLKEATLRQLKSVGLSFQSHWNNHEHSYRIKKAKRGASGAYVHGGDAYAGVLLTAGAHKGDCLMEYLDHLEYKPKRVVFVDDKMEHLDKVKSTMEARDISFLGIRYGYLDEKIKAFNPEITAIQLEYLNKILSDEDAKAILSARKSE